MPKEPERVSARMAARPRKVYVDDDGLPAEEGGGGDLGDDGAASAPRSPAPAPAPHPPHALLAA